MTRPVTDPTELPTSSRGNAEHPQGEHTVALWSRPTAEEIETMLREDLARGVLSATETAKMIARVWERTEPDARSQASRPDATR